mgnify:CR=1 FL=1
MSKAYIRRNIKPIAVILFLIVFYLFVAMKSEFLFGADGSVKQFGLGNTTRTVLPLWLIAGTLGILSYMAVLYYIIM